MTNPDDQSSESNSPDEPNDDSSQPAEEQTSAEEAPPEPAEGDVDAGEAEASEAESAQANTSDESNNDADSSNSDESVSSAASDSATSVEQTGDVPESNEGDLPEYEPLTPELVEDEAVRGDFMLRWAVILLALLLGIRHITETATLVHIRSGEYLTSNGILPPANDVLSYTAQESPWINLSWLFDIAVANLHGIGGPTGLSILTGLVAAVIFYMLVNVSRKETPTWWNAVCAALALTVVHQQFTVLPEIITLLGTVWMVRGLCKWSDDANPRTLWCLAFSLFVWSNLDPRAYIGWLILVGYLIGTAFKPIPSDADKPPLPVRDLVIATVLGLIALAVNPFGWNAWLSPVSIYLTEIPTLLRYTGGTAGSGNLSLSGAFSEAALFRHTHQWISGLSLAAITLMTCILNWRRLNLGLAVAFVFVLALGIWHSHELALAAIVGSALAGLNGQDWYRANCEQSYSTNTWEVLYGRVGRALTVLGLATVAWLGISGRLMSPDGKRVGVGFAPQLAATIKGTAEDLKGAHDGNIFTFRLDQGDLLIWNNNKSFVDSRVHVFAGDEKSIIAQHDQARQALRPTNVSQLTSEDQAKLTATWKKILDDHKVTQAIPRLWGYPADYPTYERLWVLPEWLLTNLGSTTAVFVRADHPDSRQFAIENEHNFVRSVFLSEDDKTETTGRTDWPRAETGYQQFLSLPASPISNSTQKARHALKQAELLFIYPVAVQVRQAVGLALANDAIRNANKALTENVNNAEPYQLLADSYGLLQTIEDQLQSSEGYSVEGQQRYFQTIYALHQFLKLHPDDFFVLQSLLNIYANAERWDLAYDAWQRCLAILDKAAKTEQTLQFRRQLMEIEKQIAPQVKNMTDRIEKAKQDKSYQPGPVAFTLVSQGFPLTALRVLEEDEKSLQDIRLQLQYALALAECGRLEEASKQFENFARQGEAPPGYSSWRRTAAWVEMARGNYDGAIDLCRQRIATVEQNTMFALLGTVPLIQPPPSLLGEDTWPVAQTAAAVQTLRTANETADLRWTIVTCYLETGRNKEAAQHLQDLLDAEPDTYLRPVVRSYLELITGKEVAGSASDQIPFSFEGGPDSIDETADPKQDDGEKSDATNGNATR